MTAIFIKVEAITPINANIEEIENITDTVGTKDNTYLVPLINDQ